MQPRSNCKPKRAFFQDASSTPHPPLGVRYSLAIRKSNVELFQISQSSFPFSNIPSDTKRSRPLPERPLLPAEGPVPAIRVQSTAGLCAGRWLCFPRLTGTGTAMRCKAPGDCFGDCHHHRDPSEPRGESWHGRAVTLRPGTVCKMVAAPFPSPILIDVLLTHAHPIRRGSFM